MNSELVHELAQNYPHLAEFLKMGFVGSSEGKEDFTVADYKPTFLETCEADVDFFKNGYRYTLSSMSTFYGKLHKLSEEVGVGSNGPAVVYMKKMLVAGNYTQTIQMPPSKLELFTMRSLWSPAYFPLILRENHQLVHRVNELMHPSVTLECPESALNTVLERIRGTIVQSNVDRSSEAEEFLSKTMSRAENFITFMQDASNQDVSVDNTRLHVAHFHGLIQCVKDVKRLAERKQLQPCEFALKYAICQNPAFQLTDEDYQAGCDVVQIRRNLLATKVLVQASMHLTVQQRINALRFETEFLAISIQAEEMRFIADCSESIHSLQMQLNEGFPFPSLTEPLSRVKKTFESLCDFFQWEAPSDAFNIGIVSIKSFEENFGKPRDKNFCLSALLSLKTSTDVYVTLWELEAIYQLWKMHHAAASAHPLPDFDTLLKTYLSSVKIPWSNDLDTIYLSLKHKLAQRGKLPRLYNWWFESSKNEILQLILNEDYHTVLDKCKTVEDDGIALQYAAELFDAYTRVESNTQKTFILANVASVEYFFMLRQTGDHIPIGHIPTRR